MPVLNASVVDWTGTSNELGKLTDIYEVISEKHNQLSEEHPKTKTLPSNIRFSEHIKRSYCDLDEKIDQEPLQNIIYQRWDGFENSQSDSVIDLTDSVKKTSSNINSKSQSLKHWKKPKKLPKFSSLSSHGRKIGTEV